jgi:hypothetical protein
MKKKQTQAKPKKPRASKYEEKVTIKGTFADLFRVVKKNKEENQKKPL